MKNFGARFSRAYPCLTSLPNVNPPISLSSLDPNPTAPPTPASPLYSASPFFSPCSCACANPSPDSNSLLVCAGDYAYHSSSLLFRSTSSICKTARLEIQNQMGALLVREFGLGDGREAGLRSRYPQPWYRLASTEGFALDCMSSRELVENLSELQIGKNDIAHGESGENIFVKNEMAQGEAVQSNMVSLTSILGGTSDNTGSSMARRLVLRTGLNIVIACNIPKDSPMLEELEDYT